MVGTNGASQAAYDVVIVGGGPVGSTCSTLLKKYNPDLRVLILEKEKFPRDHVGESQLPSISPILNEMGVWEKVEGAGFPIKIGASYTWGGKQDRWDFDFYPVEDWKDEPRPAKFDGQRQYTAFQVDRAQYDEILLRHAESLGVEVREQVRVVEILRDGDRIEGFVLDTGETVTGKYYIDGSGAVAILRRALGVESDAPTELRNIAIWDYWENAEWAVEIGVGATRVQVRSLPWGWIWFIPLGPTRTSIGLICPSSYYKETGKTPEDLYHEAVRSQPDISRLIESATPRGMVESCKDWSHLAERLCGENWFLAGESAGFADPILAAGMSLAHSSAREVAYTILELERGETDPDWLRERYDDRNRTNIRQHIRFAQFWYSANGCFTDLQEHCSKIAREAGLRLQPKQAWRWLSQGGFVTEAVGIPTAGSFDVASAKQILELFDGKSQLGWLVDGYNIFKLNLSNAQDGFIGHLADGRIQQIPCYVRGEHRLPRAGYYGELIDILQKSSDAGEIYRMIQERLRAQGVVQENVLLVRYFQALEVMIQEDWVQRKINKKKPKLRMTNEGQRFIRFSEDTKKALEEKGRTDVLRSNID